MLLKVMMHVDVIQDEWFKNGGLYEGLLEHFSSIGRDHMGLFEALFFELSMIPYFLIFNVFIRYSKIVVGI